MSAIYLLIPISMVLAAGFLGWFIWAVKSGQYEDTCTPALRMLIEEDETRPEVTDSLVSSKGKGNHER